MGSIKKDIQSKIKYIQIKTRRLLTGSIAGNYVTKRKGYGLEFEQLREYQVGDDVRFIDWKSSARSNKLLLKEYCEERNRTVMLLVDISKSSFFGSSKQLKSDVMADITSALALAADYTKDAVGLVLFSDTVHSYIPPARGKAHVMNVLKTMYAAEPKGSSTTISQAMQLLGQLKRTDTIAFLISDCIDEQYQKTIHTITARYDLVVVRCLDAREQRLPASFHIQLQDLETGEDVFVHSNALALCDKRLEQQNNYFRRHGIDCFDVTTHKPYLNNLIQFFQKRVAR